MKVLRDAMKKKAELQIAPLIDVVFLLLIYFMVTSTLIKQEADLSFVLPIIPGETRDMPVEVLVEISARGEVEVKRMRFTDMGALAAQLATLNASAVAAGTELIVSILPDDKGLHGSVVGVMDACAAARVGDADSPYG